jgi:anthranilate synthase component 1
VDHHSATILFVANVFVEGQSDSELLAEKKAAQSRIEALKNKLAQPHAPFIASVDFEIEPSVESNQTKEAFLNAVEIAKEHVRQGDVFQVVLSQNFATELNAEPLTLYRLLRALNPSPYMYLLNGADSLGKFAIVGSSPESLVTVTGADVVTHPIAGSRPRGKDWESDQRHESDLQGDRKEIAEHLMLVDLARNDLLRVCEPDSVAVTEFMQVHRFSHIMHLVSTVEGKLREGQTPIDVFRATFPAGTLSGAPKPRALEIITQLEPTDRGLYGGVCGYFDFAGNSDLAIAIRTAFVRDGRALVQAGAGIVLDSDPVSEYEETRSKARAVLRAIAAANKAESL